MEHRLRCDKTSGGTSHVCARRRLHDGGRVPARAAIFLFVPWVFSWACGWIAPRAAAADAWAIDSVGVYGGVSPSGDENYRQVEGLVNVATPLRFGDRDQLNLAVHVQAGAGAVWASGDTAFVGGAGPRLQLRYGSFPLWLEIGSRAGVITDHEYGEDELGGPFQFTSHAALGLRWQRFRVGARFQHTSHAGVYSDNDGYNILGGVLEWGF